MTKETKDALEQICEYPADEKINYEENGEPALTVEKLREQLTDEGIVFTEETLNTLAEEVIRDYDNDDVRAACWEAAMNEAVERARGSLPIGLTT